jgi:hypothetical protein
MAVVGPVRLGSLGSESQPPLPEQVNQMHQRCDAAKLALILRPPEEMILGDWDLYVVEFPAGREKRSVFLYDSDDFETLLSFPFEKFSFLADYEAIVSRDDRAIEAPIRQLVPAPSTLTELFRGEDDADDREELGPGTVIITAKKRIAEATVEISIQTPSAEAQRLLRGVATRRGMLTLSVRSVHVSTHDEATRNLRTLSTALFVQIDANYGVGITLLPRRKMMRRRRRRVPSNEPATINFPEQEYDDAPASLYFYGREATRIPLLQFLAFYQTVEFYFPVYSQAAARRRIRNILKDPTFRPDRDSDLARLLTTVDPGGRFGLGDERAQLLATVNECVDPQELRVFIESSGEMKAFLSTKNKALTDVRLPIENHDLDLRQAVAERIYDIRCRIVHTKGMRRDVDLLLPNSKEAAMLGHDIELVQFVALKTLIAASSKLSL